MQNPWIHTLDTAIQEDHNKQRLIAFFIANGASSIADMAKEVGLSVPTVTKLLKELRAINCVAPIEKSKETGTWNATLYHLNPARGYFLGVDVKHNRVILTLTDFQINIVKTETYMHFTLWENEEAQADLFAIIEAFLSEIPQQRERIISMGFSIPGRIDSYRGISYSCFHDDKIPFTKAVESHFHIPALIDNDTRCMGYGEYMQGAGKGARNVIYANISWGIGVAMIINREIYYGKSGFSGEYGHFSVFDNEIVCVCGKKGCLETEASGRAVHRKFMEELKKGRGSIIHKMIPNTEDIMLNDILEAARREDVLAIEVIQETGRILGKHLAGLLNLFNPDVLVLGGTVGRLGNYIAYPIKSSLMQYSLNYVNNDTEICFAELDDISTSLGSCMLTRSKWLQLIKLERQN